MKLFPIQIFASTCVIRNNQEEILILRRSWSHKSYPFFWQLPEGKPEKHEDKMLCAKRELYEETGIKCKLKLIKAALFPISVFGLHIATIQREVFAGKVNTNKVILSREHSSYKWVKKEEIRYFRLVPGTKEILQG